MWDAHWTRASCTHRQHLVWFMFWHLVFWQIVKATMVCQFIVALVTSPTVEVDGASIVNGEFKWHNNEATWIMLVVSVCGNVWILTHMGLLSHGAEVITCETCLASLSGILQMISIWWWRKEKPRPLCQSHCMQVVCTREYHVLWIFLGPVFGQRI